MHIIKGINACRLAHTIPAECTAHPSGYDAIDESYTVERINVIGANKFPYEKPPTLKIGSTIFRDIAGGVLVYGWVDGTKTCLLYTSPSPRD